MEQISKRERENNDYTMRDFYLFDTNTHHLQDRSDLNVSFTFHYRTSRVDDGIFTRNRKSREQKPSTRCDG